MASPRRKRTRKHRRVSFLAELKRRGVLETGLAYLVFGWLLIQVADVTFDKLPVPDGGDVWVTYLVIVGFPLALLLAWFIEITARGPILDTDPGARPERAPIKRSTIAILGALGLASLGVYGFDRYVGLPVQAPRAVELALEAPIEVEPNSIAVLPFYDASETDEGRLFSQGIAEDILDRILKIPALHVSARADSFSLAPDSTSAEVRKRLRVAYYLSGSVQLADGSLRVIVQLVDSASGFYVLRRTFEVERSDFFSILSEITSLAVASLRVALPFETQSELLLAVDDTYVDAYLLYRRGMSALHEPETTESIEAALRAFEGALELDPDYAAAHGGLCRTHVAAYTLTGNSAFIGEAERACAAALARHPNLDIVHHALGDLYVQTGQYEAAQRAYERAFEINPNAASSLLGLAQVYHHRRAFGAAEDTYTRAIGLQPGNWRAHNEFGRFLFWNGRLEEATAQFREVVSLDVRNGTGWENLGSALTQAGRFREARSAYEQALSIDAVSTLYINLGLQHYYLGEIVEAVSALEQATQVAPNHHMAWSNLGDALQFSAAPDRARAAFETAEELAQTALDINNRNADTMTDLAWIKAMLGKHGEAGRLVETAARLAPENAYVDYIRALIRAQRGDNGAAIEHLETAAQKGWPTALMAAEPHLRRLRGEPRFSLLVESRTE